HPLTEPHGRICGAGHDEDRLADLGRMSESRLEVVHIGLLPRGESPASLPEHVIPVAVVAASPGHLVGPSPALAEVGEEIRYAGAHADRSKELGLRRDEGGP